MSGRIKHYIDLLSAHKTRHTAYPTDCSHRLFSYPTSILYPVSSFFQEIRHGASRFHGEANPVLEGAGLEAHGSRVGVNSMSVALKNICSRADPRQGSRWDSAPGGWKALLTSHDQPSFGQTMMLQAKQLDAESSLMRSQLRSKARAQTQMAMGRPEPLLLSSSFPPQRLGSLSAMETMGLSAHFNNKSGSFNNSGTFPRMGDTQRLLGRFVQTDPSPN